jgi:hypothetical protein
LTKAIRFITIDVNFVSRIDRSGDTYQITNSGSYTSEDPASFQKAESVPEVVLSLSDGDKNELGVNKGVSGQLRAAEPEGPWFQSLWSPVPRANLSLVFQSQS